MCISLCVAWLPLSSAVFFVSPVQYIGTLRRQIYILFPFPRVLVIFINQYCTKYKGGGETLSWRWLYEGFGSPPAAELSIKKQSSFIPCHCSPVAFAIDFYYRTHGQLCGSHGQSMIFTGRKKEPGQDAIWYVYEPCRGYQLIYCKRLFLCRY